MFFSALTSEVQKIESPLLTVKNTKLYILREDLSDREISGNKLRKLKYNIQSALSSGSELIITFGGAFSNHILAVAKAGYLSKIKTLGVIRGEKQYSNNTTLKKASAYGMGFKFISRENYKKKESKEFLKNLTNNSKKVYLIPEGGTNEKAIKGCKEIINHLTIDFDSICCSVGTGGTLSGIAQSTKKKVYGFPAYKADKKLLDELKKFNKRNTNYELINDYHFGGYAKYNSKLIRFINDFNTSYNIPLDFVYTGKMIYGILDKIANSKLFDNQTVLAIHTGGIQGNKGLIERGIELPLY